MSKQLTVLFVVLQEVTVIIPTLSNTKGLKKLLKYFSNKPYPVIIVNNNPDSKPFQTGKENVIFLQQKRNLGFAKAVNLGVKKANTNWVLILNDENNF